jgi:CRISPR-associated endoribonuclease Cas6
MRAKLEFKTEKGTLIPFNHQYHLASAIYNVLNNADGEYSKKLHDYKKYKFFTFSLLNIPKRKMDKNGIITRDGKVYLYLSSPNNEFLGNFVSGILDCYGSITINGVELLPNTLTIEKIPEEFDILKTISPVYLKTLVDNENGAKKIYDLLPDDAKFYENFKNNLKRKYEEFYGKKCDLDFNFEILKSKQKRMKIKNTFCRCSELVFKVEGDYDLIRFGYECGFGEKNSMGFGMCRF